MILEMLESRTLLSVAAVNSQIQADQAQVNADLVQFRTDLYNVSTTINADVAAIRADDPEQATTLTPLVKKLHQDVYAMHLALDADLLAQSAAVRADRASLIAATEQFVADAGHPAARQADRQQILADRIKMENDMVAGLNTRIATRKAFDTEIFADLDAILTAVQGDSGASTQLQADVQKFTTDRTAGLTTLLNDLTTIKTDRTKLVADLAALQSQPPIV